MLHNNIEPIFIVGNSRSGTTMMATILAKNPTVHTFKEIHFFERILTASSCQKPLSRTEAVDLGARLLGVEREGHFFLKNHWNYLSESQDMLQACDESSLNSAKVYSIFLSYVARKNGKMRPCEQTPQNIFYFDEILSIESQAKFIHIVRDPRAILLSQKYKWKRRQRGGNIPLWESCRAWANYHPITISRIWKSCVRTGYEFKENPNVYTVRFEDFVDAPESQLQKICKFLNLSYSNKMLDVPHKGSSHVADNDNKRGINASVTEKWKTALNVGDIYWCQYINKDLMSKFGYRNLQVPKSHFFIYLALFLLPFKTILTLVFNLRRFNNIISTIKQRIHFF